MASAEEDYPTLARWAKYGVIEGKQGVASTTREAAAALAELNRLREEDW